MWADVVDVAFAVLLPLWLACGFGDYLCHRATRIEATSGLKESTLHQLQLAQIGLPLAAVALLDITAPVLALVVIGVVAHTLTAHWDVTYTEPRREIPAFEQHLHGVLLTLPIVGAALLLGAHRSQLGFDGGAADWGLRWKSPPLQDARLLALFGGSLCLAVVPMAEEWLRCFRARGAR
jgi:hypothetical protein